MPSFSTLVLRGCICMAVTITSFTGCSKDDEHRSFSISGRVLRQSPGALTEGTAADVTAADAIWAVPFYGADAYLENLQEIAIAADGSFEITPDPDSDSILILVNRANCGTDLPRSEWTESTLDTRLGCMVGYVALKDALTSETLIALPTSEQIEDVDLGEVTGSDESSDEAVTETSLEETAPSFGGNIDKMRDLAKVDDLLKSLMNRHANRTGYAGQGYDLYLEYKWHQDSLPASAESVPSGLEYSGYTPYFGTNVDAEALYVSFTSVDGYLQIAPPGDVTCQDEPCSASPTIPFENDTDASGNGGIWMRAPEQDYSGFMACFGGLPAITGITPEGEWKMRRGGDAGPIVAKFNLAMAAPFDQVAGVLDVSTPRIFIPLPRFTLSGELITEIAVDWFVSEQGAFRIVDPSVVYQTANSIGMGLQGDGSSGCPENGGYNSNEGIHYDAPPFVEARPTWVLAQPWRLAPGDATACGIKNLGVYYIISGTKFGFTWGNMND